MRSLRTLERSFDSNRSSAARQSPCVPCRDGVNVCARMHLHAFAINGAPMQTISVRVPDDDLEWLLGLDMAGVRNPSDRIRSLIAADRRLREGMTDYVACVSMLRDFL